MRRCLCFASALCVLLFAAGCGPNDPLRVETVQLGRSLNPDNSVAVHATAFKPSETIYVSALSPAPGAGTVKVRWSYEGRVVDEPERAVDYSDSAATEFHLVNAAPGNYSVEVFVDGQSAGARNFRVDAK